MTFPKIKCFNSNYKKILKTVIVSSDNEPLLWAENKYKRTSMTDLAELFSYKRNN